MTTGFLNYETAKFQFSNRIFLEVPAIKKFKTDLPYCDQQAMTRRIYKNASAPLSARVWMCKAKLKAKLVQ